MLKTTLEASHFINIRKRKEPQDSKVHGGNSMNLGREIGRNLLKVKSTTKVFFFI